MEHLMKVGSISRGEHIPGNNLGGPKVKGFNTLKTYNAECQDLLQRLERARAFVGIAPSITYFVKYDRDKMSLKDIHQGIVNIAIGFVFSKPAGSVILRIWREWKKGVSIVTQEV
jgi:hypothetical protein